MEQLELPLKERQKEKELTLNDLKVGYVIGLTQEGNLIFEFIGQNKDIIQLLGLHKIAGNRLKQSLDMIQNTGDKLVIDIIKLLKSK